MIQKSSSDASVMLNKMSFVILPVFNPDGYEYTWTVRMISIIIYLVQSLFSSSLFCNFEAHLNVITEKAYVVTFSSSMVELVVRLNELD